MCAVFVSGVAKVLILFFRARLSWGLGTRFGFAISILFFMRVKGMEVGEHWAEVVLT